MYQKESFFSADVWATTRESLGSNLTFTQIGCKASAKCPTLSLSLSFLICGMGRYRNHTRLNRRVLMTKIRCSFLNMPQATVLQSRARKRGVGHQGENVLTVHSQAHPLAVSFCALATSHLHCILYGQWGWILCSFALGYETTLSGTQSHKVLSLNFRGTNETG